MSSPTSFQEIFSLPVAERITLADQLYASVPDSWQWQVDQAWLDEAERRLAEMDSDTSMEMSHEEFLAGIEARKKPDS